jgi:glycosyltransferase involved in cell wall biosynthesis
MRAGCRGAIFFQQQTSGVKAVSANRKAPKVTVGLPVFNGENYLREAIESVLSQSYTDFELIVRDNASNDGTAAICLEAAQRDSRVRYLRNESNIGAGPNFNGLVELARGEYFKWLAHDDLMAPGFLAACVETLESDRSAVLACPRVRFVDLKGTLLEEYVSPHRTDASDRVARFSDMLKGGHRCFEVFGVIRLADLKRTRLLGNYNNGDGVLLSHLALLGRFAIIAESLFYSRQHPQSSMYVFGVTDPKARPDHEGYANWFDPRNKIGFSRSLSRATGDFAHMLRTTPMRWTDKLVCGKVLAAWMAANWRGIAGEWKRVLYRAVGVPVRTQAS